MKISVAIITRKRAEDLKECLESLSGQIKKPYEVVVVDNGPTQATKKVVEGFKKKLPIKYVVESKIGVSYARNKAIKAAKGEIIAFCDDDCVLDEKWIRQIELAFKRRPKNYFFVGKSLNYYPGNIFAQASFFFYKKWWQETDVPFDTKNGAFKKKPVLKYKIQFDSGFAPFGCGEDVDFGEKLIEKGMRVLYEPKMVVYHKEPNTFLKFLKSRFERGRLIFFLKKEGKKNTVLNKKINRSYLKENLTLFQKITKGLPVIKRVFFSFCLIAGYLAKNFGYFSQMFKEG